MIQEHCVDLEDVFHLKHMWWANFKKMLKFKKLKNDASFIQSKEEMLLKVFKTPYILGWSVEFFFDRTEQGN